MLVLFWATGWSVEEQARTASAVYCEFHIIIHNTKANAGSGETPNSCLEDWVILTNAVV